jgi:hypothetical protein
MAAVRPSPEQRSAPNPGGVEFVRQFTVSILAMFVAVSVISQQPATPGAREPLTREAFTQQVQSLEQRVQSNPEDANARGALLQLYGTESFHFMPPGEASKAARPHALWLIEHQPHSDALLYSTALLIPQFDPEGYQQAATLWTKQIEQAANDPVVLERAGHFYATSDRTRAEALFVRVLQLEPGHTMTASTLTKLYDWMKIWRRHPSRKPP